MKKLFVVVVLLYALTGCLSNSSSNDNRVDETDVVNEQAPSWNYREGFVIAKQDGQVLVVRNEVSDIKAPLNELLQEAKPDAIWLSVDDLSYNAVTVGEQVSIHIANGMIDQSFPAQATAELFLKGQAFEGYVVKVEKDRMLVVTPEVQDFSAAGGQQNYYEAIWFSKAPPNIEVGMKVEVWAGTEILESYPAQGAAKHTVIIKGTKPEGAERYEHEAVREVILELEDRNPSHFTVVTDVKYDASSSEWTVYVLNEKRDQVISITVPDTKLND